MSEDASCFTRRLPAEVRDYQIDDVKRLTGWVFDVAAAHKKLQAGVTIDLHSTLAEADVPGFGGVTDLSALRGRYRLMRPPFDDGNGYYAIELGALDEQGVVSELYLINRLFRLPVLVQDPLGVATDLATNGAMMAGAKTEAIVDLEQAAETAYIDANAARVPLLTVGQSQAGGEAQLAAAFLIASHPSRVITVGFVSMNGARANPAVRRLGIALTQVQGISFVKDLDPGMGPHGLMPNEIGFQVYIHPDGSGGAAPGDQSFFEASVHPREHLLASFMTVSLADALKSALAAAPDRCDG